jgi:hypothetical protein
MQSVADQPWYDSALEQVVCDINDLPFRKQADVYKVVGLRYDAMAERYAGRDDVLANKLRAVATSMLRAQLMMKEIDDEYEF